MRYHVHVLRDDGDYRTVGVRISGVANVRMIVNALSKNDDIKRIVVSPMDIGEDRAEYIGDRLLNGDWEVVHDELG